jgi:hypothetical protein
MSQINEISSIDKIRHLMSHYSEEDARGMLVERRGTTEDAYMLGKGLHRVLDTRKKYALTSAGVTEVSSEKDAINVQEMYNAALDGAKRPDDVLDFHAQWLKKGQGGAEANANILGDNGRMIIDTVSTALHVIPIEPTPEHLAYYGAVLLHKGNTVEFPEHAHQYPLWTMSLGASYVEDYLMTEKGGGWYLEWHTDKPHLHMPLCEDAAGAYLLAKEVDPGHYHASAFKITSGQAVYTLPGAIHADAGLVGSQWVVGYDKSDNFSTVLVRNLNDKKVNFTFL